MQIAKFISPDIYTTFLCTICVISSIVLCTHEVLQKRPEIRTEIQYITS